MKFSSLLPVALGFAHGVWASLPVIQRKGSFLFDSSSGNRFYIKGVAYAQNYGSSQSTPTGSVSELDPLANPSGCNRDIPYLQQLGVNVIRVYQVNASLDHTQCMQALDTAGIYVLLDLASPAPNDAINTVSPSWNLGLLSNFLATVDVFGGYTNVLGFNVGNEVINTIVDDGAAPYIKAAVRDVKAYTQSKGFTQLVGYTATDSPTSRAVLPYYLSCEDTASSIDYWGINIYEWCGQSDFITSGYQARTEELQNLGVPAFFSEFGCNAVTPRTFQDIPTLYSSNMTGVWSGGIIYEYFEQENAYGLGTLSPDGSTFTTNQDFQNLKNQYSSVSPANVSSSSYTPTISQPVSCPASNASWPVSTNLPPTPNSGLCDCIVGNLTCRSTTTDLGTIGTTIGTLCGESGASTGCSLISGNGTLGTYGQYSGCDPVQQLDIALDAYYEGQGRAATACNFGGVASVFSSGPTASAAVASATSACLAAFGSASTSVPSGTTTPSGAFSSGAGVPSSGSSGSGGSSTSSHSNGAVVLQAGLMQGAVVVALMFVGAAMVVVA
ncbi:Glucanosyltransferase-domain-containing protein [Amylocystis lapponica]|nr:Glucanosyltransferase-domain-containing protein [Amylocystis lapponica]